MDLEIGTSAIESVEDNELDTASYSDQSKDNVNTNGSCSNEIHNIGTNTTDERVKEGGGIEEGRNSENSQPSRSQSPSVGSPPVPKGFGLRKWRRIKRDFVKDASPNEDNGKALKRVLSMSGNPNKATNIKSPDMKPNNMGVADGLLISGTSTDSRFAVGSAFSQGTDSENSEDRSSKSSTAASAPRLRYDLPAGLGYNRIKNLSGKGTSSSTQRVQQGKGRVESSKKHRGERIKIEKENSHSSIESDSRSSNFVFAQGARSVTSNGNQNHRSMYYDGENSNHSHVGEQHFGKDVHADYDQEDGEVGDGSQDELAADASWEGKAEKIQNHRPSLDGDPLVESIVSLQSVQEALESEVQKFREIGRISSNPVDSIFFDRGIHESSSSEQLDAEKVRQSSWSESQVLSLTENVKYLESRLEEAEAVVKVKESRITELENTLISGKSVREESGNTTELLQDRSKEIESELEQIFRQKMEVEVEYLILSRTMQKLRVGAGDQITLFEQQKALAGEQTQMMNKLGEAEKKAEMLEKKADKVEKVRGEILGTEEVLKMQRKVCKVSWCLFIQLVLLLMVLSLVMMELSPHRGFVVPT
ncbi:WPP domain-interacting protein 1 [Euphorbia lathyris]|uniref:WPP domain-interacting protein 1 n=1 Tax=Euphorbia lathyris TaxID=212925 RepID=UPI003313ED66